ncbi:MAG: hypothetical protein K2N54_05260, partial [Helicobacter sp.]|nr:hypothetical protein [Helicobacter sp.]
MFGSQRHNIDEAAVAGTLESVSNGKLEVRFEPHILMSATEVAPPKIPFVMSRNISSLRASATSVAIN